MIMQDLSGRTAFVTGGATGIGLGIARALANRGANVMLGDVDASGLARAREELQEIHLGIETVVCDVRDIIAVQAAADAIRARFGKIHVVVNNAGVAGNGAPGSFSLDDWRWIVDINLMGVVHGIEVFAPLIQAQGEGGYFVNTASIAGHIAPPGFGPYSATKFAVVGLSEALRQDLEADGIGVSVLCPGWVRTGIANSAQSRPSGGVAAAPGDIEMAQQVHAAVNAGLDPDVIGEWTVECMAAGRFYIFSHPSMRETLRERMAEIEADYAACADDARFEGR